MHWKLRIAGVCLAAFGTVATRRFHLREVEAAEPSTSLQVA